MYFNVSPLAYIDPGTGSFLLQILLAGLLGGLASLKMFWGRLRSRFPGGADGQRQVAE